MKTQNIYTYETSCMNISHIIQSEHFLLQFNHSHEKNMALASELGQWMQ